MTDLYSLWSGFGTETKAALIEAMSTVGVGIIGFGGLILQMKSQGSVGQFAANDHRVLIHRGFQSSPFVLFEWATL